MGVRLPSVFTNTFVGPLPANATETVILTTPPLSIALDFAAVLLFWVSNIGTGAGTTSLTYRLRRGTTITGALVFALNFSDSLTAGQTVSTSGCYFDTPGAVAGQQYSLTVIQTAATAAGVFNDGSLIALML